MNFYLQGLQISSQTSYKKHLATKVTLETPAYLTKAFIVDIKTRFTDEAIKNFSVDSIGKMFDFVDRVLGYKIEKNASAIEKMFTEDGITGFLDQNGKEVSVSNTLDTYNKKQKSLSELDTKRTKEANDAKTYNDLKKGGKIAEEGKVVVDQQEYKEHLKDAAIQMASMSGYAKLMFPEAVFKQLNTTVDDITKNMLEGEAAKNNPLLKPLIEFYSQTPDIRTNFALSYDMFHSALLSYNNDISEAKKTFTDMESIFGKLEEYNMGHKNVFVHLMATNPEKTIQLFNTVLEAVCEDMLDSQLESIKAICTESSYSVESPVI